MIGVLLVDDTPTGGLQDLAPRVRIVQLVAQSSAMESTSSGTGPEVALRLDPADLLPEPEVVAEVSLPVVPARNEARCHALDHPLPAVWKPP